MAREQSEAAGAGKQFSIVFPLACRLNKLKLQTRKSLYDPELWRDQKSSIFILPEASLSINGKNNHRIFGILPRRNTWQINSKQTKIG